MSLAAVAAPHAHGQGSGTDFPSRPIRLIVPFAPGGGTDITARIVGQRLSEAWGQPVVIDNRPGAGTMVGTEIVQKAPADGHTLMIASASHALNPSLYRKVSYDPLRDFHAVTLAVSFSFLLAANPGLPVQSVRDLVALANAGRLRALAVSSAKRAKFAPDLPTVAEAGVPGYDVTGWYAFLVPAATPMPVVERMNREMTRILDLPAVRERFTAMGAEPWPTPAADAQGFIAKEVKRWGTVIREAGIRAD